MSTTNLQSTTRHARLDEMTFNMFVDCGCSTRETARQMGISRSTVTARQARSAALDARLAALGIGEG